MHCPRTRVLVCYASRFGSTRAIAEHVAAVLSERGSSVDVKPASEVDTVDGYDVVVFGSAVFNQKWMAAGERFVNENVEALAARAGWLFSVGTFGDTKRVIGPLMRREPTGIRTIEAALHPRDYRVFAGVIDRHQWPFFSRLFYHALGGHLGDNRDWPAIDAWAAEIADASGRERAAAMAQAEAS
jgi:menaquinone-dependent protoporphyrinogen oxidase